MKTVRLCVVVATVACCTLANADTLVFRDDFSTSTLAPAWSVQPGQFSYSLTTNPGHLQYAITAQAPATPLGIYRQFSGTQWTMETSVTYSMLSGLGRSQNVGIQFGDFTGTVMPMQGILFSRHRDDGYSSNIVDAYGWDNSIATPTGVGGLFSGDTYFVRIVRNGQNVKVQDSPDGLTYATLLEYNYSTALPSSQSVMVWGSAYWSSTTADYDYVQVTAVPEPATLTLVALGGLAMFRRRR